ncbi:hypothetical protein [Seohaeicola sp.]|uniref:hypothetical protein n=1 Tax=Seohaeicola sp. TaxID=2042026 RepID=UPI003A88A78D
MKQAHIRLETIDILLELMLERGLPISRARESLTFLMPRRRSSFRLRPRFWRRVVRT